MTSPIPYIQSTVEKNRRLAVGAALIFVLSALLAIEALHGRHVAKKAALEARAGAYRSGAVTLLKGEEAEKIRKSRREKIMEMEKGLLGANNPSIGAALLQEAFKSYASRRGIPVASQRTLPAGDHGVYKKVPVEFQFKAKPEELKGLFDDIKGSPMVMGVRSVRVKSNERGPGGRLDVSLVLEGAIRR